MRMQCNKLRCMCMKKSLRVALALHSKTQ